MTPDSMTVRLHLYRIRVVDVLRDLPEHLEVLVRDLRSVVRCPFCGFKTTKVHETRRVRVKDVPRGAQKVTLVWLQRRFQCDNCGERHTEAHPGITNKMTTRLARRIVTDARHLSITEIARRYGLSWHTVMTMVREWSARIREHRRRKPCRILLIDETSLRRRHRYVTVVQNAETGEVLGVVKHRDFRVWGSKTLIWKAARDSAVQSSSSLSSRGDSPASTTTVCSSNEHHCRKISSDRSRGHSPGSVYQPTSSASKSSS